MHANEGLRSRTKENDYAVYMKPRAKTFKILRKRKKRREGFEKLFNNFG